MTWSDFYLLCFFVGFIFSVLSFLGGATHLHLPARLHWPFHGGHHAGGMAGRGTVHARGGLSWFHAMTIKTFLPWFGGLRYLLTTHSRPEAIFAVSILPLFRILAARFFLYLIARI